MVISLRFLNRFLVLVAMAALICPPSLLPKSFQETQASVEIDDVRINDKAVAADQYINIVAAQKDSLVFYFHCQVSRGGKSAFLFRISLINDNDSASTPWNKPFAMYKNLPEGNYRLRIEAFDPKNQMKAEPALVNFKINNYESNLVNELRKYKALALKYDSLAASKNKIKPGRDNFDWLSSLLGLFIGAAAVAFISMTTHKKKNKNKIEFNRLKNEENKMAPKSNVVPKIDYDKALHENSNLRAEISALRGQIDALYLRTEDLNKQNRDLKDTLDRLMNSKKELEDLQKQKDDLFAVIIHDIKNPAALIKSLVDLLRSYDLTALEQQDVINDIFETTSKIVMLSQEVTKILTLEGNNVPLKMEVAQISEIIKDVHRRNAIAATNKSIDVLLELNENVPETLIDVQKMDEVIENLVSNAIKFSNSGGKVKISAKRMDNKIVVEISDNGLGLSEEDIKKAFQRGIRLSAQPTAGEPSSGFGLWIVKKLVEAHKGHVWVKSVLGYGSTFSFSIPVITDDSLV